MAAGTGTNMQSDMNLDFNKRMGIIGIELLTKAALCAATMALIAGLAAAVFYRAE